MGEASNAKIVKQFDDVGSQFYLEEGVYAGVSAGYAGLGKDKSIRLEGEFAWRQNGNTESNTTYSLSTNQLWVNFYRDINLGCTTKPTFYSGFGVGMLMSRLKVATRSLSETNSGMKFGSRLSAGFYYRLTDKLLLDSRYSWSLISTYSRIPITPTEGLTGVTYSSLTMSLIHLF